ncbi:hypothetical protein [Eubacterium oxidoreducens]|uniref:Uncharacterized protein n=1 Tax=Eubacterium oxidoreducens TaxID=1732 RepID=A0A1G6B269_EUBOX|nr:hypothetical protein [Eubacterium oxidoreducens]SDB14573.1 hypothetical protein SAMN02910417_01059 [Eubacterium oxidoreducens]
MNRFNGNVYQNEIDLSNPDFDANNDQLYFELEKNGEKILLGLKDLLICLRFAELKGEVMKLPTSWWVQMQSLYGNDILLLDERSYHD